MAMSTSGSYPASASAYFYEKKRHHPRHVFAKPPECPVLASYQMWYCQKLLKNAKFPSKIVKIWPFLWKVTSGSAEIQNFRFWAFLSNVWPKIVQKCQKTGSCGFQQYQMWLSTKMAQYWLFYCGFWHFWAIFGKTTSDSSPKQDIINLWAVHVCITHSFLFWKLFPALGLTGHRAGPKISGFGLS